MIRKDYLPNHPEMIIFQRDDMFKLNTDTFLLGEFFDFYNNESLLDIGVNNGALLLYASLKAKGKLIGIDIFDEALELCKKNLEFHNIEATLINCNASNYIGEKVDVIVSNPPFFKKDGSTPSKSIFIDYARREALLSLDHLFVTVKNNLKQNGRFYLVHRADRKEEIIINAKKHGLSPCKIVNVYDKRINKYVTCLFHFEFIKKDNFLEEDLFIPL